MSHNENQFGLLKQRRFLPFFLTQFLGAFNDNLYKNALVILIAFQGSVWAAGGASWSSDVLVNVAAGLFILPFFLFSATAGQLADKFEASRLIRYVKALEIIIMLCAAIAFALKSVTLLIILLFLMGTQSTLFGPVKYGYLPSHLQERELTGGNGMVELGTFLAILLGTIAGGELVRVSGAALYPISMAVIGVAVLGWFASLSVPFTPARAPELKLNWNLFTQTWRTIGYARENRAVFLSIMGISWFWAVGALYLAQLPNYVKVDLGGNEQVVTLLLAVFSLGIGIGSMLCERLSSGRIELGLVPFGALGLVIFGVHLGLAGFQPGEAVVNAAGFLAIPGAWRVVLDLGLIGLFGGLYIVPLYALIQQRSDPAKLSRIIAANSIINALFMVAAAIYAIAVLATGISIPQLFLISAMMTAAVTLFIFKLMPEFSMRFIVWILVNTIYRVKKRGLENIPDSGGVLLVCNHVSYMDGLIIGGVVARPVRFVMYHKIFELPVVNFVFRTGKAIPIASAKEDRECLEAAYERIAQELEQGEVVCIFPEGTITEDGEIGVFKQGVERIIARSPVPVVPMALQGLWGSFFSRARGAAMSSLPRRFWSRIGLAVGPAQKPNDVTVERLQAQVMALHEEGHV